MASLNVLVKINSETNTTKILMLKVKETAYFWDIVKNNRRWVEYADYFLPIGNNGDKVPVGWQGWMSYQYDDTPTV